MSCVLAGLSHLENDRILIGEDLTTQLKDSRILGAQHTVDEEKTDAVFPRHDAQSVRICMVEHRVIEPLAIREGICGRYSRHRV